MANPEHLAILKQGVEVWNKWREENPHVTPDLSDADLRGAKLRKADLSEAVLQGAHLTGADLSEASLHGAKLRKADLFGVDLHGAKLQEADLSEADVTWAHLRKTDLQGAHMNWTNLHGTDLREAHLSEADLHGAKLSGVHLNQANLSKADLSEADLSGADLTGADVSETNCTHTRFADMDLSEVRGLETIEHRGPSTIGIDTLLKSKGKIPEVFLRGCGVPEEFITYMPSLIGGSAIQYYSCFISYSHVDKSFAQRVHDTLQGRGIRCWLDDKQILPGHDILTEVDRGIRLWDKTLLCASRTSLHSGWVDTELNKALDKERDLTKERRERIFALIPLDIDGYLLSSEYQSPVKSEITRRSVANFQGWESDNALFEREIEKVIKALRTDEGRETPPPSKL